MAAGKFGNGKTSGFEQDVANIFSSLGVVGGVLYLVLMMKVLMVVVNVWKQRTADGDHHPRNPLVSQLETGYGKPLLTACRYGS